MCKAYKQKEARLLRAAENVVAQTPNDLLPYRLQGRVIRALQRARSRLK